MLSPVCAIASLWIVLLHLFLHIHATPASGIRTQARNIKPIALVAVHVEIEQLIFEPSGASTPIYA
jgi:hypothetical protein